MLTKMRGHHSQCWSLVSTCHGHPSCPMIRPIKDHHQSLDPCACSTSEYPSFFPCVASSWLEEHRNASLSNSCQKGVSEQEGGCAHQCQLGQPWRCYGHKIIKFHWLRKKILQQSPCGLDHQNHWCPPQKLTLRVPIHIWISCRFRSMSFGLDSSEGFAKKTKSL